MRGGPSNSNVLTVYFIHRHYCPECNESMCPTCALQDSQHIDQHYDIQEEIQQRQDDLQRMSIELTKKKSNYSDICERLKTLVKDKENMMKDTRELLQLLTNVNNQYMQEVNVIKANIETMEGVLERMTSSGHLLEKMHLYAQGQETMAMYPFIRNFLEELQRNQPATLDDLTENENLTEVLIQLLAMIERAREKKGKRVSEHVLVQL